ncbi:pentatricopeptide repeat-containing protein At4g02750-like, partial [Phoenix dactylifera]|uniref:Pentatricopeptide repeat-containing protein At4g02750-like n=1 Tax=Phoenix dactylifera TaxID=42345 RepID=A0A8B8ZYD4_PHODC
MPQRNLVSWNLMISGYGTNGYPEAAMELSILTAVLDMYAKCGELDTAEQIFDEISNKDVLQAQHSYHAAFTSSRHSLIISSYGEDYPWLYYKAWFRSDVSVKGLLIDMYSKCGELSSACCVFSEISEGNIFSWSCMINGLGMHGYGKEALMAFFGMLKRGIVPDDICFLVLASCSHCGLITQGRKMFYYMVTQFGVQLKMEHYASMVDLIGRAGCIDEAFKFIREMPMEADCSVVGALLGACRIHGHLEMGKVFEECLEGSGWTAAGFYKLLLSIYAGDDRWDEVMKIRSVMEEKKVK